ncbi:MAG TPA: hypothetical protein PK530_00005, partial [Anaerolineales bacterium]|nr:hypothetical protein [Anaerolineales bacterium]
RVVFSTEGNAPAVWAATEEGLELLAEGVGGQVAEGHDGLFIYNFEGVYRWDEGGLAAQVYAFGRGSGTGNIVPSPEGGVLIVHPDRVGTRVLAFDAAGKLVWERALRGVVGQVRAIRVGERVFLLAEVSQSSAAKVFLYQVDLVQQALLARLVAGTRTAARGSTWIEALNPSQVVLQIGGGHQVLFDASLVP